MRVYDCKQGSEQWDEIRRGRPTASRFGDLLDQRTFKMKTKAAYAYASQLSAELDRQETTYAPNWAMERGTELEPMAIEAYERATGNVCEEVGFVYPDDNNMWGCSPDRLVYERGIVADAYHQDASGLVEAKCPLTETFKRYLYDETVPTEYMPQVQGQLWITRLDWCDFFVFHPEYSNHLLIRVEPDERYFEAFENILPAFCRIVKEMSEATKPMTSFLNMKGVRCE